MLLAWILLGWEGAVINVLVAPWAEEAVIRYGVQDGLLERMESLGPRERNILSSACVASVFTASHILLRPDLLSAATFLPAFAIGLVYGRVRTLAPCVSLHAAFNLIWFASIGPWLHSVST